jgi:RNA polymerase sigma-70 factor (ECF subfamily)
MTLETGDGDTLGDGLWKRLCEECPGVVVGRADFQAFLAARSSTPDASGNQAPTQPELLSDLFLAFACGRGDSRAIGLFEERFGTVIERVRRRFGPRAPTYDELLADVNQRLFAPRDGSEPRILGFSGQSSLSGWLKVVATRILLNRLEAARPEDPMDDRLLDGLGLVHASPEHLLQREEARAHFKAAFARAVEGLSARDRQMLRLAFVDGLTIDDLGELYAVHRTTAFRWLQQASERLSSGLRTILRESLKLSDAEYDRWCESLRSGLELSVKRYFGATG